MFKALGGFPIDRKNPQKTILNIIGEMENFSDRTFHLVMCPEGTRKAIRKWKTGYHLIASQAGIPVYLTCIDWGHKKTGIFRKFELSGDARADTDRIQAIYEEQGFVGKHPEGYVTH